MMFIFSLMGAIIGSAEDLLPYIPICVGLALALGFDSITGTAIVLCGGAAGFGGAFMNAYTEGVAQGIAGLPLFSGLYYRIVVYILMTTLTIAFVMIYARRVKKNPTLSRVYEIDQKREDKLELDETLHPFGIRQKLVLVALLITICLLAYGTINWGWYFNEIAGLFFGLAIVAAIIGGMSVNQFAESIANGMTGICGGALGLRFRQRYHGSIDRRQRDSHNLTCYRRRSGKITIRYLSCGYVYFPVPAEFHYSVRLRTGCCIHAYHGAVI